MINAHEAKRQTFIHTHIEFYLQKIEDKIKESIKKGMYYCIIRHDICKNNEDDKEIADAIKNELFIHNYIIEEFIFGTEKDKWGGSMTINWEQ